MVCFAIRVTVEEYALLNALLHMFVAFKRTWELKLFSVLMGGQLRSATRLCTLVSPSLPCASIFYRFHVVRTETCLTLLCRVHRYLLKSAITVCLMGHCSADVCCAKSLFPPFKSNTKCDVIIRKHLSQNDVLSSGAHYEGHDGVSSVHAEDHGGCSTKRFHCAEVLPT